MRRAVAIVGLAALVAGAVTAALGTIDDGLLTFALLAAVGATALVAAQLAATRRARIGGLSRQFGFAVAIAVGELIVAVIAAGELMFVSRHDAGVSVLIALFAGVAAVAAAQLQAAYVLRDIESVRDALVAVGEGRRDLVAQTSGRDEVAQLAGAANAMIARLAAEETARRDLIAAVSHDLRTPITSLQLLAAAVADDVVDGEQRREYVNRMETHIAALSGLIDDLFELSRLEAGDVQWTLEQVHVEELVEETVAAMAVQARAKGVSVNCEMAPSLSPARANPEKVQRVLFNLIQNAIRHTPADGSVTVRARTALEGVEIEVADTGDGIADSDRARVFDPFYRAGSDAARTESGAGLGLAISRAIVEAHGGRIWLATAEQGTMVRFVLPAAVVTANVPS